MGTANTVFKLGAGLLITIISGLAPAVAADYAQCPAFLRPQINPSNCGPYQEVLNNLYQRYNEQLVAQGLVSEKQVIELYASSAEAEAPSWSLTTVDASGQACLLAGGDVSVVAAPNAVLEKVLYGEPVFFGGLSQVITSPAGDSETRALALVNTSEDPSTEVWALILATGEGKDPCKLFDVKTLETSFDLPSELKGVAL